MSPRDDMARARRARNIGIVMAVTIVGWMALQWGGARMGWPVRLMGLIDLAVLGIFAGSLYAVWTLWRQGRDRDR